MNPALLTAPPRAAVRGHAPRGTSLLPGGITSRAADRRAAGATCAPTRVKAQGIDPPARVFVARSSYMQLYRNKP
jgi:hypothetical protein